MKKISVEHIREAIRAEVIDPELGVNVVDLGLIYEIVIGKNEVGITMTLTSMGCPAGAEIMAGVRETVASVSAMPVKVDLVWEPAWNSSRISEEGKNELLFGR